MKSNLQEVLLDLARNRNVEAQASAAQKKMLQDLHDSSAWKDADGKLKQARAQTTTLDEQVRKIGLEQFRKYKEAGLTQGVKVINHKTFDVKDEVQALAWCEANAPVAVTKKLDTKLFKEIATKLVKSGQLLPFVAIGEAPAIQIATDLSFLLQEHPLTAQETPAVADPTDWRSLVNG